LLLLCLFLSASLFAAGTTGASAAKAASPATSYPITLKTADGTLTVASRPKRILSLSASATQMLYAIGAGAQVVGVDTYSTYPSNAPRTTFTGAETNAEVYLAKHPDLVVLAYDSSHLVAQLQKLKVPAVVLGAATDVAGAEAQITELGKITGHTSGAAKANTSLHTALAHIVDPVAGKARGDTYYVELDPTFYSATSRSFIGALFSELGMTNVADPAGKGSAYPQLSAEYLVKANPRYVFLADTVCCGQSAATFAKRPGLSGLSAVAGHHVVGVNDSLASEWGPHTMVAFLQAIAITVDPSAFKAG
jgi:iron complex transport system substrate-binding protein